MDIAFCVVVILVVICCLIVIYKKRKTKAEEKKFSLKKLLCALLLFIPVFYGYYFITAFLSMIPLYFIGGPESGLWALAIIIGLAISPMLAIITIKKILF